MPFSLKHRRKVHVYGAIHILENGPAADQRRIVLFPDFVDSLDHRCRRTVVAVDNAGFGRFKEIDIEAPTMQAPRA